MKNSTTFITQLTKTINKGAFNCVTANLWQSANFLKNPFEFGRTNEAQK